MHIPGRPEVFETTLCRELPGLSSRGFLLLAGIGLFCLMLGFFTGAALLAPAAISGLAGLIGGLIHLRRVRRGQAYAVEGKTALVAATFINGSLCAFAFMAGYIVLRFGA